jgi:hypothetical protein
VSCDLQLPLSLSLSADGIALAAVAVENYDNGGPAKRIARLSCTAAPGLLRALEVRTATVSVEISNDIRPIFGDADFSDGADRAKTRRVLSAGVVRVT